MAAICGVRIVDGSADAGALDAMLGELADYGEVCSVWSEGRVGLGRRERAAPAGHGGGSALCTDQAAGLALVADARIDDRGRLCDALRVPVAERGAIADEHLIRLAWLRWGRSCPRHLLGDYAFAVWDAHRRTLFCARDHIGVRPFYYALDSGRFVFASAVEAVLAVPGVSAALDEATVAAHLTSEMLSGDTGTFFEAVRKLPPGHTLTVEEALRGTGPLRVRIERYWHPEHAPLARPATDDAYAEQFLDLYTQAVRDRLRGGSVGVHLSGGLDSSSITVLAARELRREGRPPPCAFTWLPPLGAAPPQPKPAREYALVDAVARQEGLQTFFCAISPEEMLTVLRSDVALPGVQVHACEEPVQQCAAARNVGVLLSGWGGDECVSFNGRGHLQHLLLSGRWRQLVTVCRSQETPALRFMARIVLPLLHPEFPRMLQWRREGRPARRWLIDPAFARRVKPSAPAPARAIGVRRTQLQLLRTGALSLRMEGWAASGARRGIEYRYPLLDRRLVEFALGLPPEQFHRGRWTRWLMRHGLREVLPRDVRWNRSKVDPARIEMAADAKLRVLPTVRRLLTERTPSRACYVDMPGLWEELEPDRHRANPYGAPLRKALEFLDF